MKAVALKERRKRIGCNTATECRENDNMQKGQEENLEMTESQASKGSKIKQNKENNKRKKNWGSKDWKGGKGILNIEEN